ncbi:hypothetical protein GKC30_02730 [Pseudodesulfovibrio sp. F-1]|uniref:Uncharacterized protein n=1 Tax=Pseudodesulfovibrio alkaliphilus TaxID=2661613 RepID=A0A7K1KKF1_9BACT|nr:hypothetical protein [Pseudodesulfovibrio alkaliphilus]MUM76545.1 hypothetical protein [Pseudodesulfovibrio alkaliphilus]
MHHAAANTSPNTFLLTMALAASLVMPTLVAARDTAPLSRDDLVSLVGEAVVREANRAEERVRRAKERYEQVNRRGTRWQQSEAAVELERARERFGIAAHNLDEAQVRAIAERSGRSPSEIRAMRESGMGWGDIANETGVHPSVNAKGNGADAAKGPEAGKGKNSQ